MPLTAEQLKELGIEVNEDQAKALNSKFESELESSVTGLKAKNSELLGLQKQLKEKLGSYADLDPEAAREALKKQQEIADKKLIEEGKLDELVLQRTERMKEDYEKKYQELSGQAEQAKSFANKFKGRVLSDEIRAAATALGVIPSAIDDAIYRSRDLFTVDDEGKVIPTESAGLDAKGNPLTTKAWLEAMREKAPHWFPIVQGGGRPAQVMARLN
ncbi:hypothetical protein DM558_07615 [Entomomonas moraniae]|uniref:Uncharacterized protein n=1 Tax=Entomomonas moraniae TaxID=2213226 RepID=A0A3Q9JJ36_9GAMM|nr:hypothetical protein [Entomomonas moraniae]AZS50402.1 hypothetical protein DM558_06260 [Entomomonas moraniae]AZS50653.1 hypothetical protein DM558_07615 [Entomomonas moraniae]